MAFGMGVDSLCVERVIHFGVSANYGNNKKIIIIKKECRALACLFFVLKI